MSERDLDGSAAIFALIVAFWIFGHESATTSVRVTEIGCDSAWTDRSQCSGKIVVGSDLQWRLNASAHSAMMFLGRDRDSHQWYAPTRLYKNCSIVDDENWECDETYSEISHERVGMADGAYYRQTGEIDLHGFVGWRYWLHKLD